MSLLETFRAKIEDFRRIIQPGWGIEDIPVDSVNPVHVVNNIWQRTLSFISGWDYNNNLRRKIAVDEFGRVITTSGTPGGSIPNISQIPVTAVATQIAFSDSSRSYLIIRNDGLNRVYIGTSNAVLTTTGMLIEAGDILHLDAWSTELWGITSGVATVVSRITR